jgi:small subunit ribosomal protein S6
LPKARAGVIIPIKVVKQVRRRVITMRAYEATYILSPELDEEQLTQAQEKYKEMVLKNGGEIVNIENWGRRKLAYEIDKKNEGYYVIMKFNADEQFAETLRRSMNIADEVIKNMLIALN